VLIDAKSSTGLKSLKGGTMWERSVPDWHRDLRIENTLTDENGDYVRLKKGAHVQVTVTAEPKNASADAKKRANG
jgi:hypothetical protein